MTKKALVVGIDDYSPPNQLNGCVNDAIQVAAILEKNGDGSPNFDVRCITSNNQTVEAASLIAAIQELLKDEAEIALLYFAGHGILNEKTNAGHLVTQDGKNPNWGVDLSHVLQLANEANPRVHSVVIILDSCQSGYAGQISGPGVDKNVSFIGDGLTILTACDRTGQALEVAGHGVFTSILLDALSGAASDVLGRVTPASVYAHVDQTLGGWGQRPIYKANVRRFITLREVPPKVPLDILRSLPNYFPETSTVYKLDPSFEPRRGEEADKLKHIEVNPDNARIFQELQACNRHSLVVPVDQQHMWNAAVFSTGCKLTATGIHYRNLAKLGHF